MSNDAVDGASPWTIKSMSIQARLAVITAARKEGITVGQWLERRVAEWLVDGSPTSVAAPRGASSQHNLAELAQAMDAARALADAAGVKVPPSLAREGLALMLQAARAARGLPP